MTEEEKPCAFCAGTGKIKVSEQSITPYSAQTSYVLNPEDINFENIVILYGT